MSSTLVAARMRRVRDAMDSRQDLETHTAAAQLGDPTQQLERTTDGIPVVAATDLGIDTLNSAFAQAGCLIVRGFLEEPTSAALRQSIDQALDDRERDKSTDDYTLFSGTTDQDVDHITRLWTQNEGGCLTIDSPSMLDTVTALYERTGVVAIIEQFLGTRPVMAAEKAALRRLPADGPVYAAWHQDGPSLGTSLAMNAWLALSDCGDEAPGLEVLPARMQNWFEDPDADFDWTLSDNFVRGLGDGRTVVPTFQAGDLFLFDHLLVHRTHRTSSMHRPRYNIETWFFAPANLRHWYLQIGL